jgi:hypothetical protein
MLLKKSAMGRRRATIESRAMTSWIELARSVAVLNQYCSEDPLKILFQQHRPSTDIDRSEISQRSSLLPYLRCAILSVGSTGGPKQ